MFDNLLVLVDFKPGEVHILVVLLLIALLLLFVALGLLSFPAFLVAAWGLVIGRNVSAGRGSGVCTGVGVCIGRLR